MLQSPEILYQDSELNILQIILDMHSIYKLLLKMVNPCPIPDFLKVPASVHSVESRHTAPTNLVPYPDIRRDVYRAHHRIPNAVDAVVDMVEASFDGLGRIIFGVQSLSDHVLDLKENNSKFRSSPP